MSRDVDLIFNYPAAGACMLGLKHLEILGASSSVRTVNYVYSGESNL